MKVAICDDNFMDLRCLQDILWTYNASLMVTAYNSASELLRAFDSIFYDIVFMDIEMEQPNGYEAAEILGYGKVQTFFKIIFPQVMKRILPSITNETITLVKDTSLAFVLSQAEMFTLAKQIAAAETSIMPLMAAGLFYYIFNLLVAAIMERIEKSMDYYH